MLVSKGSSFAVCYGSSSALFVWFELFACQWFRVTMRLVGAKMGWTLTVVYLERSPS